jgi:hypothetical protein
MVDALLKIKSTKLQGKFVGEMFNLSLSLFAVTGSMAQKRLLLENCAFRIIEHVKKDLKTFALNGGYKQISNSFALKTIFEMYKRQHEWTKKFDIFALLFFYLHEQIRVCD